MIAAAPEYIVGNEPRASLIHQEDDMIRTISSLSAAAVLVACTIVLAQTPLPSPEPTPAPQSSAAAPEAPKAEQKEMHPDTAKGKGKSHLKKRGLDRADEAAGEHGKKGRDKARAQHMN